MFSNWNKIDILILVLAVLTGVSYITIGAPVFTIFLWTLIIVAFLRILHIIKKKLFWKIRNRLVFSSIFFIVTPILFLTVFFYFLGNIFIAQYGTIITDNIFKINLNNLKAQVDFYLALNDSQKIANEVTKTGTNLPDFLLISFNEKKENGYRNFFRFPPKSKSDALLSGKDFSGYFKYDKKMYLGILKGNQSFAILLALHLNQDVLDKFTDVSDLIFDNSGTL